MKLRFALALFGLTVALLPVGVLAQAAANSVAVVPPHDSLLPASFGEWKQVAAVSDAGATQSSISLMNVNKAALEEDNPKRSEVGTYANPAGKQIHVQAVEFHDYTGAYSAYTLLRKPGLKDEKALGQMNAVAPDGMIFVSGAVLGVVYPAVAADVKGLQALVGNLPQVHGAAAQPPLLPSFVPAKNLEPGSVRYAVGAATYQAQGGVFPAQSVGWDKNGEAVTASYKSKDGVETLTLLIYPTPQIAGAHLRQAEGMFGGLGPKFANACAKRDHELVAVASGEWPADVAKAFVGGIHMNQIATYDKNMEPSFNQKIGQTASMLSGIAMLCIVLCSAAVILGLFFGGGRALIRIARGKPAAAEVEFLSLHRLNQNAKVVYTPVSKPGYGDDAGRKT